MKLVIILLILGLLLLFIKLYEKFSGIITTEYFTNSIRLDKSAISTVSDPTLALSENKTADTPEKRSIVHSYLVTYGPNKKRYGFKETEINKAFPNIRIENKEVTNIDMVPILWQCCNKLQTNVSYYKETVAKLKKDLKKANDNIAKIEASDKDKLISKYKKELERYLSTESNLIRTHAAVSASCKAELDRATAKLDKEKAVLDK